MTKEGAGVVECVAPRHSPALVAVRISRIHRYQSLNVKSAAVSSCCSTVTAVLTRPSQPVDRLKVVSYQIDGALRVRVTSGNLYKPEILCKKMGNDRVVVRFRSIYEWGGVNRKLLSLPRGGLAPDYCPTRTNGA